MKIFKNVFPFLFALLLFSSCNNGAKNNDASNMERMDLSEIMKAADAISLNMNSVEDVFATLDLTEAAYYPVLCNDPYNAEKYLKSKATAAANLGVYVTDIVYHMYGEANEDMFLAFSASQELARYIGLESEFAATLITELEGGAVSRDSLINVFSGLMEESESYNSAEEMLHVHTAFLAGVYVEKLFITSSLLEQSQKKEKPKVNDINNFKKLLVVLENQLQALDIVSESIAGYSKELKNEFNLVDFDQLSSAAQSLSEVSREILNSDDLMVSEELSSVHEDISSMRTRIISAG